LFHRLYEYTWFFKISPKICSQLQPDDTGDTTEEKEVYIEADTSDQSDQLEDTKETEEEVIEEDTSDEGTDVYVVDGSEVTGEDNTQIEIVISRTTSGMNYTKVIIKRTGSAYGVVKLDKIEALEKLDYDLLKLGLGIYDTNYDVGILIKAEDGRTWSAGKPITPTSKIVSMYSRAIVIDGVVRAQLTVAVFRQ